MVIMATDGESPVWSGLGARLRFDEPLAHYTTFHIGGPADLFVAAEKEEELLASLVFAHKQGMDCLVLGTGSNILVSDQGVRGLVILNRTSHSHIIARRGEVSRIHVASGVPLGRLARQSARWGLGGLEWAVGIPGTLGGAIVQNAGAYGSCMADVVRGARIASVRRTDSLSGLAGTLSSDDLSLGYRTSRFRCRQSRDPMEVILSACLELHQRPWEELRQRMAHYVTQRRATQPRLPSAGSVFRNPPGDYAARLIDQAGLKGMCRGDAMVADKHSNFIVNLGHARASDVKGLIDQVRATVAQKLGVELEPEIQLVGDWHGSCS